MLIVDTLPFSLELFVLQENSNLSRRFVPPVNVMGYLKNERLDSFQVLVIISTSLKDFLMLDAVQ